MITREEIFVGLMSGSSLDGIDLALVSFVLDANNDLVNWHIIDTALVPFDNKWNKRLTTYQGLSVDDYFLLESDFSLLLGEHIKKVVAHHDIKAVGVHGHTLAHIPEKNISIQLGNGGLIASIAEVDVVTDFRIQDIGAGGQGAPIVPAVERALFPDYKYFLNLGGIVNVSNHSDHQHVTAFDIGPCNQLLNHLSSRLNLPYDNDGAIARTGTFHPDVMEAVLRLPYFNKTGAKSLSNQWIQDSVLPMFDKLRPADALRTAVELIATTIAQALNGPGRVLITGGGAHNTYLIERLRKNIGDKPIVLHLPEKQLIDFKEALLMAYMAYSRVYHKKNVFKSVTGADDDYVTGAWYTHIRKH